MDISNIYISSDIPNSLEVIWNALYDVRENLIPEGDESYDKQWGDICFAMNRITNQLGYETSSNGDLVSVKK
tara:strand:+ start:59 stop:274 length:216 start_codon:yes stop_codon:yes gene_type:complete